LVPEADVYVDRNDKKFHCQDALPGIRRKDIDIQLQRDVLSTAGQRETRNETNDADVVYRQWMYDSSKQDSAPR
jgi:HSP20 family molecular chaperone IbpA